MFEEEEDDDDKINDTSDREFLKGNCMVCSDMSGSNIFEGDSTDDFDNNASNCSFDCVCFILLLLLFSKDDIDGNNESDASSDFADIPYNEAISKSRIF
jgi:hypothetical protein